MPAEWAEEDTAHVRQTADEVSEAARRAQTMVTYAAASAEDYLLEAQAALAHADAVLADLVRQAGRVPERLVQAKQADDQAAESGDQIASLTRFIVDPRSGSEVAPALAQDLHRQGAAEATLSVEALLAAAAAGEQITTAAGQAQRVRDEMVAAVDRLQHHRDRITVLAADAARGLALAEAAGPDLIDAADRPPPAAIVNDLVQLHRTIHMTVGDTGLTVTEAHQTALETANHLRQLRQYAEQGDTAAQQLARHTQITQEAAARAAQLLTRVHTELQNSSVRAVPSGISLLPDSDQANQSHAGAFAAHPDLYHVFAHGTRDTLQIGERHLSPSELATLIRADRAWRHRTIVLISCDTGADPSTGFAAQLARELAGTIVVAPSGTTWTTPDGRAIVAPATSYDQDGRPQLTPADTDQWQAITAHLNPDGESSVEIAPLGAELPLNAPDPDAPAPVQQTLSWVRLPQASTSAAAGNDPVERTRRAQLAQRAWSGWSAPQDQQSLSAPTVDTLSRLELHALVPQPGTFYELLAVRAAVAKAIDANAVDASARRAAAQAPARYWTDMIGQVLHDDRANSPRRWPLLGLENPGAVTVAEIQHWIAGGLSLDAIPDVLTRDLGGGVETVEVILKAAAVAFGVNIRFVRLNGEVATFTPPPPKPSGIGPRLSAVTRSAGRPHRSTVTLASDGTRLFGTVPFSALPALLRTRGMARVVRWQEGPEPVGLPADRHAMYDVRTFLEDLSGLDDLAILGADDLVTNLNQVVLGQHEGDPGPGLSDELFRVRTAIGRSLAARPNQAAEPEPTWVPRADRRADRNRPSDFQVDYLEYRKLAAVAVRPGPNAFFEALQEAGRYQQPLLSGLRGWSAADLRGLFAGLLQADLATAVTTWPLAGYPTEAAFQTHGPGILDLVTELATAGAPAPQHTPTLLARAVAEVFGVQVVLIGPSRATTVRPFDRGASRNLPVVSLLVSRDGHVMPTVAIGDLSGRVITTIDRADEDFLGGGEQTRQGRPETSLPAPPRPVRPGPLVGADNPLVVATGVAKRGLPQLERLVERLRRLARAFNQNMTEQQWDQVPQQLLSNFRAVIAGGWVLAIGDLDVLVGLSTADPQRVGAQRGTGQGKLISKEIVQGTFQTGGYNESSTEQAGATRTHFGMSADLAVMPGVLKTISAGLTFTGTANSVSRTTGAAMDAETGHVELTRGPSTLYSFEATWHYRVLARPEPRRHLRPDGDDRLLLWIPDHYLEAAPADTVRAIAPAQPAGPQANAGQAEPALTLPDTFFASGLTGLPDLYGEILNRLQETVPEARLQTIRTDVMQKVWNLETHLDTAVNSPQRVLVRRELPGPGGGGRDDTRGHRRATHAGRRHQRRRAHREGPHRYQRVEHRLRTHQLDQGAGKRRLRSCNPLESFGLAAQIYAAWTATNSDAASAAGSGCGFWCPAIPATRPRTTPGLR